MLSSARGRILFWEGASMWVLSAGPAVGEEGFKGTLHSHHAVQVTFALDGWYRLESGDLSVDTAVAAVAPDARHAITSHGTVAFVYIEPESVAGRAAVRRLFAKRRLVSVETALFGSLPAELLAAYRDPEITEARLIEIGRALVAKLSGDVEVPTADERVSKVIFWANAQLATPIRLADAAAVAGLSPDRLRHVFVRHTGLPFRTYVLWLRLLKAVEAFSHGESLTNAAHQAGFADSAHLSRTFRRTFGVAAAELRIK
jgi:AraC family transcriptional regulator